MHHQPLLYVLLTTKNETPLIVAKIYVIISFQLKSYGSVYEINSSYTARA